MRHTPSQFASIPAMAPAMAEKPAGTARDEGSAAAWSEPLIGFVETGLEEPRPRLLVDRLLYARMLLQASPVLSPRFVLGDCAAAHHIVLDGAGAGLAVVERLLTYGFRVEPSFEPPGIRFFLSSWHSNAEIRALLIAITLAVRELLRAPSSSPRTRASGTEAGRPTSSAILARGGSGSTDPSRER